MHTEETLFITEASLYLVFLARVQLEIIWKYQTEGKICLFWKASGINEGDMWGNGNLLIYLCLLVCDRPCMLMSSSVFNQTVDWETDKISILVKNIAKQQARQRHKWRERERKRARQTDTVWFQSEVMIVLNRFTPWFLQFYNVSMHVLWLVST